MPADTRLIDLNALTLPGLYDELQQTGLTRRLLELARDEDLGPAGLDVTGRVTLDPAQQSAARLNAREPGVAAGLACIDELIEVFCADLKAATWQSAISDGDRFTPGDTLGTLTGPTTDIVRIERTLLNLVSRLSGIATRSARFVRRVEGTQARILDTRKTTPGLRMLEKYAVRCGGAQCHRLGLYDAVLIKDNHLAGLDAPAVGRRVADAAHKARSLPQRAASGSERSCGSAQPKTAPSRLRLVEADPLVPLRFVEVEVDSLDQLEGVLGVDAGLIDFVLLDNFSLDDLARAIDMRAQSGSPVLFEASGGVSLDTVSAIAKTGVDRISVGGLTHQAVSVDLGLDIGPPGRMGSG